jgi:hypothetical protein
MGYFRKAKTIFVDTIGCDGSGCYAEISAGPDDVAKTVDILARDAGWLLEYPQWFCPSCAEKAKGYFSGK